MANKRVDLEVNVKSQDSKLDIILNKLNKLESVVNKVSKVDAFKGLNAGSKTFNSVFSIGKISSITYAMSKLTNTIAKVTKESSNFIENLNLTEVAFYGNSEAVRELYSSMSELYNLDESQIVRRIGVFKQMANAMGLSNEAGQELSSLMNKMTLDISSLYNIDIDRASNALQSALVGQTRPIRGATGADITEKTLERTVGRVVPDKYIRNLSFVEKRLIMVISLTEQLKTSQGDFARTLESPANQMRILGEQTTRFTRALGNLLMPILGQVLPYLNAFFIVLTEITNALARLVGYKLPKFDYSGLKGMSDSALDLEEQLNGAGESANKLKSGLRGFDKLNVITTPQKSGGAGAGSGIDPRILDEFYKVSAEYNDMMDSVKTRASKIAEDMLKWLGFEKDINGEWRFRKITLGTILTALGGIIALSGPLSKIFGIVKKIGLFNGFTTIVGGIKGFAGWVGAAIPLIGQFFKGGTSLSTLFGALFPKVTKVVTAFGKWITPLGGALALITGSSGMYKAMKNLTKGTEETTKEVTKMTVGFAGAVAGGAALGSVIPGVGTAVGALAGAVVGGISAWAGYNKAIKELAYSNVFGDLSISQEQWQKIIEESTTPIVDYGEKLETLKGKISELGDSFQSNSETMDLYQYKFGVVGTKISEEDVPKITSAVKGMVDSTSAMIEENTNFSLTLWGDMFQNMSSLTDEEEKNILNSIISYGSQQQSELSTAQNNITKTYDDAIAARGYLTDEEYIYIQTQLQKIRELTQNEMTKNQVELEYFKQISADKNLKLTEESYKNLKTALDNHQKEMREKRQTNYEVAYKDLQSQLSRNIITEEEFNKLSKELADGRIKQEEQDEKEIESIRKTIFQNLANQYSGLTGDMSKEAKEQRKIIEGIFKDFKIPKEDIVDKFATVGKDAGKKCVENIGKGFNNGNLKLTLPKNNQLGLSPMEIPFTARFSYYKNGGFPDVGNLFVANEAGPEVVTTLGGKSVVANMEQMMTYLDRRIDTKLGNNRTQKQPAIFNIQVGSREYARYMLEDLNEIARDNGSPLTIGG